MKKGKFVVLMCLLAFGLIFFDTGMGLTQEKTVITFAHPYGPPWDELMQKGIDAVMKKHPNIEIKLIMIPWDGMIQKLATMVAAGNPPNVVHTFGVQTALAHMGILQDITPFTKKDPEWNPDDLYSGYLKSLIWKGKIWGLYFAAQPETLAWNKKLFSESGLNSEVPPKTLDEVLEFHQKIYKTDANGKIVTFGFIPTNMWNWAIGWLYEWGGEVYSEEDDKVIAYNPVNERALQWMVDFFKKYGGRETISAWQQGFTGGANDPFIKGKLGIQFARHYNYYFWNKYGPKDFLKKNVGYAPLPEFPGSPIAPKGAITTTNFVGMLKNCKHQQAAYTVIKEFCIGEGNKRSFIEYAGYASMSKSLNKRVYEEGLIPDWYPKELWKIGQTMLTYQRPWPTTPVVDKLKNELLAQGELALHGKKSVKDALKYVDKIVQREIERAKRRRR